MVTFSVKLQVSSVLLLKDLRRGYIQENRFIPISYLCRYKLAISHALGGSDEAQVSGVLDSDDRTRNAREL